MRYVIVLNERSDMKHDFVYGIHASMKTGITDS
jgi:hypothetical protein